MNIFDAKISGGRIIFGDAIVGTSDVQEGDVKLGIRPEHLMPDIQGGLEVSLQMAEPLGANTLLHGWVEGNDPPIKVSLAGVHRIEAEQARKGFSVNPDHIHPFDPVTGKRLEE